jgi:HK97 family phage major capsid protein
MQTLDHPTGSGSWIWQSSGGSDGTIAGYQAKCSNQIANNLTKGTGTNLSSIFYGDFSNVLLGIWSGLDVMVDPYSESSNAIIKIIAKQLVDLELTRGEYFSVATDVINV